MLHWTVPVTVVLVLALVTCLTTEPVYGFSRPSPTTNVVFPETTLDKPTSASVRSKKCVIVGGGPVGLAAALTLSNPPHGYNVTVLEQRNMVYRYDPAMAYLYLLNPRGLSWCQDFPIVMKQVEEFPDTSRTTRIVVPANPSKPIPPGKTIQLSGMVDLAKNKKSYWIPRHSMVSILHEACSKQQEPELLRTANNQTGTVGSIQLLYGQQVESIDSDENDLLTITCADGSTHTASLVVGADGMDSRVRSCLANHTSSSTPTSWLQSKSRLFSVRRYKSPASGLRFKSLQFPPNFVIPNTTTDHHDNDSSPFKDVTIKPEIYALVWSVNKGRHNTVFLGFLPMKDSTMIRPANSMTRPDHEIWKRRTGPAMKEFYVQAFPRLQWGTNENDNDTTVLITDDEWERFAKANGTTFPYCQYSLGSALASPSRDTGVVFIGDACHAFPPDIGQGINSGLQDVVALDRALRGHDILTAKPIRGRHSQTTFSLGDALEAYQKNRGPEHKALIQLARCGAPYQYKQSWRRDQVGRLLWTLNAIIRLLFNKVTLGLFPPIAIVICQNHDLTFRQVMRRAHLGSQSLLVLSCIILIRLLGKGFTLS